MYNAIMSVYNKQQTHIVKVTGYSSGGDGVARLNDGKVVFIRNAARDDELEIRLIKEQARSARAEIVRILAPSPFRTEPDCPYYPECGGCDYRHITYEEEQRAKLQRVNDAIERIGGLAICAGEILSTGQLDGYRNKAVFHSKGQSVGFYRAMSHEVIRINSCLLLDDALNDAIKALAPGGEITLRSGRNGLQEPFEVELDGLVFQLNGFFQVNTGAALLLYKKAREYAQLSKTDVLIDLYCGVGALTLFAGRDASYALGVERNAAAVETARENAALNGLPNIEFITADVANWKSETASPDCIIVDPPRKGLSPGAVRRILELSPNRIVYVSCDPATLARDLRALEGYAPTDICAVDMFPRTANVECCCLLVKKQTSL